MASDKVSDKVTGDGSGRGRAAADLTRVRVAQALRLVCTLAAVVLAVGALLIALRSNINEGNSIVTFVTDLADRIDGPFSRNDGIFTFSGKNGATKEALVNWGIAALVYLAVGRVLDRVIRP